MPVNSKNNNIQEVGGELLKICRGSEGQVRWFVIYLESMVPIPMNPMELQ